MDPILRVNYLVTFSFLESLIFPHLPDESVREESAEYLEDVTKRMLPLIEFLELDKLETVEDIRRELFVDFGTLPLGLPEDEKLQAKILLNLHEEEIHIGHNFRAAVSALHLSDHAKYDLQEFNSGIVALGVDNFMMAATRFCEEEAAGGGIDIVSVGSGIGTIERAIMAEYRSRYGKALPRIKLVDPDPAFHGIVDFKTVDHLIQERPDMVGNSVAFIIWPLPRGHGFMAADSHEAYDIEAVRKLQPRAVFVLYECTGFSGSDKFRTFLRDERLETISADDIGIYNWIDRSRRRYEEKIYGLDNYEIIGIAHQKVWLPRTGMSMYRMVKLKRHGSEHDSSDL